ncbi:MAG: hypothetical protein Q9219_001831 [cf. Caloplaca sp. 3 TL-2023]
MPVSATQTAVSHLNIKQHILNISTLPYEIKLEILSYLLIHPSPLVFRRTDGFKKASEDVPQILHSIDLTPEARRLFYRYNTFQVDHFAIQAFLNYRPPESTPTGKEHLTPKNHVRHLLVLVDRAFGANPVPTLRSLLGCPKLRTVIIRIHCSLDFMADFDPGYMQVAGVCAELSNMLGEGLRVEVVDSYRGVKWIVEDFRGGETNLGRLDQGRS